MWCGVPKALLPKGNGQNGLPRTGMQAGRAVCLYAHCVFGVCPLVPAALPWCGSCGSPGVGGGCAPAPAAARCWRCVRAVTPASASAPWRSGPRVLRSPLPPELVVQRPVLHKPPLQPPPPPFRREKPNVPAQRSGEPFFQQKRFPVPRISVPGRKHTFLLVFGSWSNVETQSIPQFAKKNFISRSVYGSWSAVCQNLPLVQWICTGLQSCVGPTSVKGGVLKKDSKVLSESLGAVSCIIDQH